MRPVDLIVRLRDDKEVSKEDVAEFVRGITNRTVPEYQISAFLMTIFFRGLRPPLMAELTMQMRDSGKVMRWPAELQHLIVDKHSTGGVGDKVSLILAPLAAACGLKVPMISGRGLGHTGGTLDKLESIGVHTDLSLAQIQEQVLSVGFAIVGQTDEIAPVDRTLYSLRDVTGTVESVPLIASSILSKKLAAGLSSLVLDLKVGSGAFMKTRENALELSTTIQTIAKHTKLNVSVIMSDMSQPLGEWIGNYVELHEALEILRGKRSALFEDTRELSVVLTTKMVMMAFGWDAEKARSLVVSNLENGSALTKFEQFVARQGGKLELNRPVESFIGQGIPVNAGDSGFVTLIEPEALGRLCMEMGGGRATVNDTIDYFVGIRLLCKIGDKVEGNTELARIYQKTTANTNNLTKRIRDAFTISPSEIPKPELILTN